MSLVILPSACPYDAVIAIAANKVDTEEKREISRDSAESYARSIGALFFETSAKNNTGLSAYSVFTSSLIRFRYRSSLLGGEPGDCAQRDCSDDHALCVSVVSCGIHLSGRSHKATGKSKVWLLLAICTM